MLEPEEVLLKEDVGEAQGEQELTVLTDQPRLPDTGKFGSLRHICSLQRGCSMWKLCSQAPQPVGTSVHAWLTYAWAVWQQHWPRRMNSTICSGTWLQYALSATLWKLLQPFSQQRHGLAGSHAHRGLCFAKICMHAY